MSDILIIDRSATLTHLAQRTLAAVQISGTRSLVNYTEARDQLRRQLKSRKTPELVILGVQATLGVSLRSLMGFLCEEGAERIPLLVMTHERTRELDAWLQDRPVSQVLLWSEFGRIPAAVRRLISVQPEGVADANKGLRLLFVDDSPSVRLAYRNVLEREGYRVSLAGSVKEALETARRSSFDLVVVDYFLPDGTGDEIVKELPSIPGTALASAAIITGSYREDIIKRCLEAGAVECMFKNEARELFVARLRSLARQVEMQKSVETERQRLENILGSVGDGIYGVCNEGKITFVNAVAQRILGYEDEDALIGKSASDLLHGVDAEPGQVLTEAYARGDTLQGHEMLFRSRSGRPLAVECSVLPLAVQGRREGSVVVFRDISGRKSAERVQWELSHDKLTGVGNSRMLNQQLTAEWTRRREDGGYSAVLYLDLDRFSFVVETLGQQAAERLLVDVAGALGKGLRHDDAVARLKDDCFVLLLSGIQLDNVFSVADQFREAVHDSHYEVFGQSRSATASVGVAILSKETPSVEHALENARIASQQAKVRGRDQTQLHVPESESRISREIDAVWIDRFRAALKEGRFVFLAQPIVPIGAVGSAESVVDPATGWRIAQGGHGELLFELLLRMLGKDGKWISPSVFVPLAERVGMMPKIDLWVVARVLRFIASQQLARLPISFTMNLSNMTLRDPDALSLIENVVRGSKIPPGKLVFEITETSEMGSVQEARRFIQELKSLGCRFALDDFGTGFSSFSHLRDLPVDMVKIEGSFVEGISASPVDRTMVTSISSMGRSLKLDTIAEHCDSFETLQVLRECGVDYVQGNYIGKPKPMDELDFEAIAGLIAPPA